jgi:hypothetical protein
MDIIYFHCCGSVFADPDPDNSISSQFGSESGSTYNAIFFNITVEKQFPFFDQK